MYYLGKETEEFSSETIVFTGTREMLEYLEKDIRKIIDTIKLEEKLSEEEQPV